MQPGQIFSFFFSLTNDDRRSNITSVLWIGGYYRPITLTRVGDY